MQRSIDRPRRDSSRPNRCLKHFDQEPPRIVQIKGAYPYIRQRPLEVAKEFKKLSRTNTIEERPALETREKSSTASTDVRFPTQRNSWRPILNKSKPPSRPRRNKALFSPR